MTPLSAIQRLCAAQRSDQVGTSRTRPGSPSRARSVFSRLTIDRGESGGTAAATPGNATVPARPAARRRAITRGSVCEAPATCRLVQDWVQRAGERPAASTDQAISPRSAALTDVAHPGATFQVQTAL